MVTDNNPSDYISVKDLQTGARQAIANAISGCHVTDEQLRAAMFVIATYPLEETPEPSK